MINKSGTQLPLANLKPQAKPVENHDSKPDSRSCISCIRTAGVVTDEGGCKGDRRGSILSFPPTYSLTLIKSTALPDVMAESWFTSHKTVHIVN